MDTRRKLTDKEIQIGRLVPKKIDIVKPHIPKKDIHTTIAELEQKIDTIIQLLSQNNRPHIQHTVSTPSISKNSYRSEVKECQHKEIAPEIKSMGLKLNELHNELKLAIQKRRTAIE